MNNYFKTIGPNWSHIPNVSAYTILARSNSNNLVYFNGSSLISEESKKRLEDWISPKTKIHWIKQVHGNKVIELPQSNEIEVDGTFTSAPGVVCAVRTADCLPIVFTNSLGTKVGIVHAGWRGLHKEIIKEMVHKLSVPLDSIYVWIGPAIAKESYEVGIEVYNNFVYLNPEYKDAFTNNDKGKFQADLYLIAKKQLINLGINQLHISGGNEDTYTNLDFHSSRRDGDISGRMATVVWIKS